MKVIEINKLDGKVETGMKVRTGWKRGNRKERNKQDGSNMKQE